MQAIEEVFLHALDCPFLLHQSPSLPGLEAFDGLFAALGGEDELVRLEAMSLVDLPDLYGYVAHLMGNTGWHLHKRVDGILLPLNLRHQAKRV